MRRLLLALPLVLALALAGPTAGAAPLVPLTEGTFDDGPGDCDPGSCRGSITFGGTFAVGGAEVTDVAVLEWAGDDVFPHVYTGPLSGMHLAGTCTLDRTSNADLGLSNPHPEGAVTCDVSVDGGPQEAFSFVLVLTHYTEDPNALGRTGHGKIFGI